MKLTFCSPIFLNIFNDDLLTEAECIEAKQNWRARWSRRVIISFLFHMRELRYFSLLGIICISQAQNFE